MTRNQNTNPPREAAAAVRLITTKRKTYVLPLSVPGTPIEKRFPGVKLPVQLQGAKFYPTEDGEVVAVRLPQKHGRAKRRQPALQKPTP
jgi:hypothetical protein